MVERASACALVVLAVTSASLAYAKPIRDGDDVRGRLDLASMDAGRRGGDVLFTIRMQRAFSDRDVAARPNRRAVCGIVVLPLARGEAPRPDFVMCTDRIRDGRIRSSVHSWSTGRRVGPARVERPDARTVTFRFAAKTVRSPRYIGWHVNAVWTGEGCPRAAPGRPAACSDWLPRQGRLRL